MLSRLAAIFERRHFLFTLVFMDIKLRYRGSLTGFFWTLANPLAMLLIFTFVFTRVVKIEVDNFPLFMLAGLLPWNFTTTSLQNGTVSLVRYRRFFNLLKQQPELFPVAEVLAALINFLLTLMVLFGGLLVYGIHLSAAIVILPLVISVHTILLFACVLLSSVSYAFWRETSNALDLILVFIFYATPVFYPVELIPPDYLLFYLLNPFACLTLLYQDIILSGKIRSFEFLLYPFVLSILLLYIGFKVFSEEEKRLPEVV